MVDVQTDLHVVAARAVCHKACQVAQRFHHFAPVADQRTGALALNLQDGGLALFDGRDGQALRAHFYADLLQILHRFAGLRVLLQVDGLLNRPCSGLCLLRLRGRGLGLGGVRRLGCFRRGLWQRLFFLGRRRLRDFLILHIGAHLGRDALEQPALGQLQHFNARLFGAYAQLGQRQLGGVLHRSACFDHFTHGNIPP